MPRSAAVCLFVIACFPALACALPVAVSAAPQTLAVRYETVTRKEPRRYDISLTYPVFAPLSPVARLANRTVKRYAAESITAFVRLEAESWREYRKREKPGDLATGQFVLELKPVVSLARPDIISLYFNRYSSTGGVHPNTNFAGFTFGSVSGAAKRLALSDLFTPPANPYTALSQIVVPELRRRNASWFAGDEPDHKTLSPATLTDWVTTPAGITLLFAPYQAGSYAEGAYIVKVGFDNLVTVNRSGTLKPLFAP